MGKIKLFWFFGVEFVRWQKTKCTICARAFHLSSLSIFVLGFSFLVLATVDIRIVAGFEAHNFQYTMNVNWTKNIDFTTISAIIFIHC